jgi:5-deoxy-glucuronate isomerase
MSSLLSRKQAPDSKGGIQKITPESAGWKYVGFEVFMLKPGRLPELQFPASVILLILA